MSEQMRILILCDPFAPPAYLPRVVNLCRNISHDKWDFTVVSELLPQHDFHTTEFKLLQMPYYQKNKFINAILWMLHFLFNYKDTKLFHFIRKNIDLTTVDIIFCSTFNLFPLITAKKISKKYGIPLVTDLRDIAEQWGETNYFTRHIKWAVLDTLVRKHIERTNIKRRNSVITNAAAITTVSPWHRDLLKSINPNTHLIFNGFDANKFRNSHKQRDTFDIVYTGRIYNLTFRAPQLLFQAIEDLDKTNAISADKVRILWYSDCHDDLLQLSKQYHIEQYIHLYDFVATDKIPNILDDASICLILSQKTTDKGPFGIMTTKFFEAIGAQKPILCVESDQGCLASEIELSHSGLAATNVEDVKEFILTYYQQWQENGYTQSTVCNIEKYSRQHQAKQFEQIFEQVCNQH